MKGNSFRTIIVICIAFGSAMLVSGQKKISPSDQPVLVPFRVGDKFGFSDVNKKVVIAAKYTNEVVSKSETRVLLRLYSFC